jgi:hypothetical protein
MLPHESDESKVADLLLQINAGPDADAEELDRLTRQLRNEIQELDVESVELVRGGAKPEGAKVLEVVTLGSLAVAVLPSVVPKLVEFLQNWLMRGENRRVKIKTQVGDRAVELEYSPSAMSQAELKGLVETLTSALTQKPVQ